MRHLDLFSGIGGFALAARWMGWETVGFCEIEPFCQEVLKKHWPDVPIYDDVRELDGQSTGPVDIITGGYPCQPFSVAGQRRGEEDDRHLWPEAARLVRELKPTFAVFENVAGHITMGLDQVLSDLEGFGYTTETFVIPACAVDAPHRRDRVWIAAYVDDASCPRLQGLYDARRGVNLQSTARVIRGVWKSEPGVDRVANGIPRRVDRLRALGNAIVPQVAYQIFKAIDES